MLIQCQLKITLILYILALRGKCDLNITQCYAPIYFIKNSIVLVRYAGIYLDRIDRCNSTVLPNTWIMHILSYLT